MNLVKSQILPQWKIIGPSFAYSWTIPYMLNYSQSNPGSSIDELSMHRYESSACRKVLLPIDDVLTAPSLQTINFITASQQAVNNTKKKYVFTEFGTASCGGVAGVSDVFGAALFAIDFLFELASRGVHWACIASHPHAFCNFKVI